MTSIIKVTPISGAMDEKPLCSLLQIDEFKCLLDIGWNESFDMDIVESLEKYTNQIDAVLLSFPDLYHLGALPYVVGKYNLSCPVYATLPVYKMGQMFMYDLYQSRHNQENFSKFDLDDVDQAFDRIVQMKYSQTIYLKGKGQGLSITPLPAGHIIGGTIWKISKHDEEDIVYMVDYNHKKERHLNGCSIEQIDRPSLLITDCYNAVYVQERRRVRDATLLTKVITTLRDNGNVIICIDTAGRVLELCLLLDLLWGNEGSGLGVYSLALLSNVSYNVVEFAKSQVEWMSDKIMKIFEGNRNNPFQFRHVHLCHSLHDLEKVDSPKVVLASQPDLECGFARDLFIKWCKYENNSLILTQRTGPGTLARRLIDDSDVKNLILEVKLKVALRGDELDSYQMSKVKKEESSDEEPMEVEDPQDKDLTKFTAGKIRKFQMFTHNETRTRWDDYGEAVHLQEFATPGMSTSMLDKRQDIRQDEQAAEIPTKCISKTVNLDVKCSIEYIDFEGRSDGESMKKLLTQVKPRQVALVHGSALATSHMADYLKRVGLVHEDHIYTPSGGEVVDATTERHIYQIRMTDLLVSSLTFHKSKDVEVTWLGGKISYEKMNQENWVDQSCEDTANAMMLPTLTIQDEDEMVGHSTVFLNEVRLNELKQTLSRSGVMAEFSGGVLVCNNSVSIKKNEDGILSLEGCLCDDYYIIRDILYSQYAVL